MKNQALTKTKQKKNECNKKRLRVSFSEETLIFRVLYRDKEKKKIELLQWALLGAR